MKYFNLLFLLTLFIIQGLLCSCDPVPAKASSDDATKKSYAEKRIITVKVVNVEQIDFAKELVSNGTLTAKEKATVPFTVNEQITRVYVKEGQYVKAGTLLAEVDNFTLNKRQQDAESLYEKSLIDLDDRLLGYSYSLKDTSKVPSDILKVCKIRSGINTAHSALLEAKHNLSLTQLIAPISGIVASLQAEANNHSEQYKYCCMIVNNNRMRVEFNVLEGELSMVKVGQKVEVLPFALPEISKWGKVVSINPIVEKGLISIQAEVNNSSNQLIDGMSVKVLVKNTVPNQIIVPKEAVLYRQDRNVVFVYKDGVANWVYVETGLENSSHICITDNSLKPEDKVIVSNNLNLAHDTPVSILARP